MGWKLAKEWAVNLKKHHDLPTVVMLLRHLQTVIKFHTPCTLPLARYPLPISGEFVDISLLRVLLFGEIKVGCG